MGFKGFVAGIALGAASAFALSHGSTINQLLTPERPEDKRCISRYPHLQRIEEMSRKERPEYIFDNADILCAYRGDFYGNGRDELTAVIRGGGNAFFYPPGKPETYELNRVGYEKNYVIGNKDFQLHRLEITDLEIDKTPQIVLEYSNGGKRRLQIFRQNAKREYERILYAEGEYFDVYEKGVRVINKNSRKPIVVLNWEPIDLISQEFGPLYTGRYTDRGRAHTETQEMKSALIRAAAEYPDPRELERRIESWAYNSHFAFAIIELIEDSPDPKRSYRELFGKTKSEAIDRFGREPSAMVLYFQSRGFEERLAEFLRKAR